MSSCHLSEGNLKCRARGARHRAPRHLDASTRVPGTYKCSPDNTILIATHGRGIFRSPTLVSRDGDVTVAPVEMDVKLCPNPVAGASTVEVDLNKASEVTVDVHNVTGLRVASLGGQTYASGVQKLTFDSAELNAGIHFLNVRVKNSDGEFTEAIKSVVVKWQLR